MTKNPFKTPMTDKHTHIKKKDPWTNRKSKKPSLNVEGKKTHKPKSKIASKRVRDRKLKTEDLVARESDRSAELMADREETLLNEIAELEAEFYLKKTQLAQSHFVIEEHKPTENPVADSQAESSPSIVFERKLSADLASHEMTHAREEICKEAHLLERNRCNRLISSEYKMIGGKVVHSFANNILCGMEDPHLYYFRDGPSRGIYQSIREDHETKEDGGDDKEHSGVSKEAKCNVVELLNHEVTFGPERPEPEKTVYVHSEFQVERVIKYKEKRSPAFAYLNRWTGLTLALSGACITSYFVAKQLHVMGYGSFRAITARLNRTEYLTPDHLWISARQFLDDWFVSSGWCQGLRSSCLSCVLDVGKGESVDLVKSISLTEEFQLGLMKILPRISAFVCNTTVKATMLSACVAVSSFFKKSYQVKHSYFVDDKVLLQPSTDLRADLISMQKIKHSDPLIVGCVHEKEYSFKFKLTKDWSPCFVVHRKTEVLHGGVSLELLSQIAISRNLSIMDSEDAVIKRTIYHSDKINTININRYDALNGDSIVQNTALLAYGLYKQTKEKLRRLPPYF